MALLTPEEMAAWRAEMRAKQTACLHLGDRTPYGVCRECGLWFGHSSGFGDPAWKRNMD